MATAASFVRGSNPIWFEVDLTAHAFDDTFFMFVLQNTIPYIPTTVWHDPQGQVPWDNPIQFLANGTLPVDIFFDPNAVYRLEFRKGNTQSDPLIYLVENYQASGTGGTPTTTSLTTQNEITNPQFALINFDSPYTLTSVTNPDPINIGPGWLLNLVGTGNVTVTRQALNDSAGTLNPTNAPYALEINVSGTWTSVYLSQRFQQNGMLWANKVVSSSVTAETGDSGKNISARLVDSNGSNLGSVLPSTLVTSMFTEYTGVLTLPATTNPDVPPAAYIEYRLILPVDVDILLTSFQLIIGDFEVKYEYLQDTVDRQIDQTYHTAYPIVPIGTVIDYFGFPTPAHYLLCDGTAVSRTTYNQLFDVLTNIETVTLTSGMPTFTVANGAIYAVGTPIEGAGVTPGTTIMSISTNTITMSANATASGAKALRFFAVGEGDGSTTFNVPDLRGEVLAGSGGTLLAASKGTGTTGGASTVTLDIASMPAHTHNSVAGNFIVTAGGMADLVGGGGIGTQGQTASTGGDGAHNNVQPTTLAGKWIRFE